MFRLFRCLLILFVCADAAGFTGAADEKYQLTGTIHLDGREISRRDPPLVFLDGTKIPYSAWTRADASGKFKFKNLHADMFILIVYVPRVGEHRETVEVSRGLADAKRRIHVDIDFRATAASSNNIRIVSSLQLSVPEKARKQVREAQKRLEKRDAEGAIAHLKKALELAPQFVDAWNFLGTLAYKSRDYPLAEKYFREALKHDPDYYPAVVNLGGVLLTQARIRESLPLNLSAVRARPDDALAHAQLGLNYYFLDNFPEAEKHLTQAISLDARHFSYPQLTLAQLYTRKQEFAAAARVLQQFLDLHPDAFEAASAQSRLAGLQKKLEGAE